MKHHKKTITIGFSIILMLVIIFFASAGNVIVKHGSINISGGITSGSNNFFVDSVSGNIGVGTSSPSSKLHVVGDINVTGSSIIGSAIINDDFIVDTNTLYVNSNTNRVGFGTSSPLAPVHAHINSSAYAAIIQNSIETSGSGFGLKVQAGNGGTENVVLVRDSTDNDNLLVLKGSGLLYVQGVYDQTTSNAANVNVNSLGLIMRSTSSIKYKTDVNDVDNISSQSIYSMRPITYKPKNETEYENTTFYGLIAEEMAEIEPSLVHYGYDESDYELTADEEGNSKRVLKVNATLKPEGVQYDRIVVLLIKEMQKQNEIIKELTERIEELEKK